MIQKLNAKRIGVAALASVSAIYMSAAHAHPRGHEPASGAGDIAIDDAAATELTRLQDLYENNPDDEASAVAYARKAAQLGRRLGDTRLLAKAAQAMSPWPENDEAPTDVLIVRANIKQIDHRFDEALTDLAAVLKREPDHPQALLSRAFIYATTGKSKRGEKDCARLAPTISVAIRETCKARVASLTGKLETSYRRMEAVLAITPSSRPQERAYALGVAAEIAERSGADKNAEKYLTELFERDPKSVYRRAAYADFLLTQNKPQAAVKVIGSAPRTEALQLLQALSDKAIGASAPSPAAAAMRARMAADAINQDFSHAREYARFALDYAGDAEAALHYARENWRVQKEPVDARILARAAHAQNDRKTINALKRWQARTGLEDQKLSAILDSAKDDSVRKNAPRATLTQP